MRLECVFTAINHWQRHTYLLVHAISASAGHRAHSRSGLLPLPQREQTRLLPGGMH